MLIYRIYYLLYSTAAILLLSCQNSPQEHITQLVEEWQGKEVRFPENPVFTRQLNDTVDYRIPDAEYKVQETCEVYVNINRYPFLRMEMIWMPAFSNSFLSRSMV